VDLGPDAQRPIILLEEESGRARLVNRSRRFATALAKAQSELSNPEKSLVATIGPDRPGEGTRSFRYAPLSSGLGIIRKALGQQQIAIVQTTAIDGPSGTIHLTTLLVHASGEWIGSDWPRVSDEFTVPLCRLHHREVHRLRSESDWWTKLGIDALVTALTLWKTTRSTPDATAAPAGRRADAAPEKIRAQRQKLPEPKPAETPPRSA
jgi:hypothetical protein